MHASNEKFNELMATAGKRLNLAPHLCGTDPDNELKELWGACDIEGHMGTDGVFFIFIFVIDCNILIILILFFFFRTSPK